MSQCECVRDALNYITTQPQEVIGDQGPDGVGQGPVLVPCLFWGSSRTALNASVRTGPAGSGFLGNIGTRSQETQETQVSVTEPAAHTAKHLLKKVIISIAVSSVRLFKNTPARSLARPLATLLYIIKTVKLMLLSPSARIII